MRTACGTACSFCHSTLSSSLAPSCGGGGGKVAVLWFLNDLLLHRSLYWCLHDLSHHLPKVMHRSPSPVAHKSFVFFKSNILSFYETTHIIISRNYLSTAGGEIRATPFPSFVRIRHRKKRNRGKSQTPSALSRSLSLSSHASAPFFHSVLYRCRGFFPWTSPRCRACFFRTRQTVAKQARARSQEKSIERKKLSRFAFLSFFFVRAQKPGARSRCPKTKKLFVFSFEN